MTHSKLKMLFCLAVSLTVLFAPILLEIPQDGKTYAFTSRSHNKDSNRGDKATFGFTPANDDTNNDNPAPAPAPVPEPATMLLVGAGALGLAAFRKKFKKK
jgi:hypothetical protein